MRAHVSLAVLTSTVLIMGCNTPPIPPGKPVDIPTALGNVLKGLCDYKLAEATRTQSYGVTIDRVTVELDLTVDGAQTPPVAVSPDIKFIPTVSYGHIITANTGSRLIVSLKNVNESSMNCGASEPAK
ncbi:hypothetical protein [Caballeronia sp. ATUFL_M1_KS5A]|uniref:hypothetical protein n=1 Tax=Caballeronia sp. ATUFL_M1_KS5A TaxID=2921778 RepID=UPI00202906CC|nr:hypothetical protein [Caballeronia sp. ATUFL_M1_KS5A]